MLVLKRKIGERIILHGGPLGKPVVLMIVDNDSSGVRLGVNAEPEIMVDREEVYERRREWRPRRGG